MNYAKAYTAEQAQELLEKIDLTDKQKESVQLCWIDGHSIRSTAEQLKVDRRAVRDRLIAAFKKCARQGYAPNHDQVNPAPPGQIIKGESILYDADNKPIMTWVKTQQDTDAQIEIMREIVQAMQEEITPAQAVEAPQIDAEKLCNCFVITDYHMGMLADSDEVNASGQT